MPDIFAQKSVDPEQLSRMHELMSVFELTLNTIEKCVPEGRYRALAVTHLEIAAMFANKGISRESKDGQ